MADTFSPSDLFKNASGFYMDEHGNATWFVNGVPTREHLPEWISGANKFNDSPTGATPCVRSKTYP